MHWRGASAAGAGSANPAAVQKVTLGYDDADRRTRVTLPNGIQITYAYDAASQLTGITYKKADGSTIGDLTYAYDAAGRRTAMGGSLARTTLPAAVASATYDANNRLTHWGGIALGYDDNGNLISEGSTTYTWNARNQLTATSQGAASYAYDAAGRRRSRTVSGVSLQTLHDGWNPIQLKQSGSAVETRLYGTGLDEIYGRTNSGASQSTLTDALGSVLQLANADQSAQADYTYGAYGQTTETPPGASSNLIRYTGREQDTAGLYYYRNRYYSPITSRFVSEDPIGLAGGENLYGYVEGNPMTGVDPEGLAGIFKNWGRGKPFGPLPDPAGEIKNKNDSNENGPTAFNGIACALGIGGCPTSDPNLYRCRMARCTPKCGDPFIIDYREGGLHMFDPKTTKCVCILKGFNPDYKGGPPPGL